MARPQGPLSLTPSERRVLEHAARGLSTKETALVIGISRYTVAEHRKTVYAKLGANGMAHAIAIAFRTGILDRGEPSPDRTT